MKKERSGREFYDATIEEMEGAEVTSEGTQIDADAIAGGLVPVDPKLIKAVAGDDKNPQFVTINVAVEGVSKNNRLYTRDTIQSICDQINAGMPDGNPGHIKEEDRPFSRPDPTTIWLGAAIKVKDDGKAYLYAKGYIMPEEHKLRSYLKRCKALGKNVAVSIYGKAKSAAWSAKEKAYRLEGFMLESVDWARSKSEGMKNDGTLVLAAEMVGNKDPKEDDVNREDVIKDLKKDELAKLNPALVSEIQADSDAPEAVVTEMEAVKKLTGDKPAESISEMQKENRELNLDKEVGKIRSSAARQAIRGMVVSEMKQADEAGESVDVAEMVEGVLRSDEGKLIIEQHVDAPEKVSPVGKQPEARAERKFTNLIKGKGGKNNG